MISNKKISINQIDSSSLTPITAFNTFTSSYNTGSFTGGFTGNLEGTSSWAVSSSQAVSSSFATTASFLNTLNQNLTFNGNLTLNGTANITGSFQLALNGVTDYFAVSVGGEEKIKINTEGVVQLIPQEQTPTAVSGGIFYSSSGAFFLGFQ